TAHPPFLPTRRSSDLIVFYPAFFAHRCPAQVPKKSAEMLQKLQAARQERKKQTEAVGAVLQEKLAPALQFSISELQIALFIKVRSEEHTSELQSLAYL